MTDPTPPELPWRPDYPIETARLRLRPLVPGDVDALLTYRGRDDVCRYLPWPPLTRVDLLNRFADGRFTAEIIAEDAAMTVGVELRETGELIGDVVLFYRSVEHLGGEIGWVMAPEHGGRGYATEASAAVLALAFERFGLHRVIARLDVRNGSSARLAERLGMRRESHLIANEWFKGEWADEYNYAMLAAEWPDSAAARLLGRPGSPR